MLVDQNKLYVNLLEVIRLLGRNLLLKYAIIPDRSLKCYDCFGFDTSFSEHDFNNTKKCLTDSFSTSVKTASKSVPDDGSVVVFCYSIVLFANGECNWVC